ncbi:MAG: NAD(P)H-dependent oxidoreductase subunit E, partial [Atopobiaceae bacterium]|nr:NAD(P)H-dependent oxidoreductase subunit E [Atopobiaceae bacterium]
MAVLNSTAVEQIERICDRYAEEKTPLIMILSDIQREYGYVPLEVQEVVSRKTGISVAEIYGVVTFYSFFSLEPKGKHVIGCCLGTACYVKGSGDIYNALMEKLGIVGGECTPDGKFSLDACRCVGACGLAP